MKTIYQLFFLLFPIMLGGCLVKSSPETQYFDLGAPSPTAKYNYQINILPFAANEMYSEKMVFQNKPFSIEFDTFNRWAQSPNKMLFNYYNFYFNNPNSPKLSSKELPVKLSIKLLKLDCNLYKKISTLSLEVSVINTLNKKIIFKHIYNVEEKMNKLTASEFALAVFKANNLIIYKIDDKLNSILKLIIEKDESVNENAKS